MTTEKFLEVQKLVLQAIDIFMDEDSLELTGEQEIYFDALVEAQYELETILYGKRKNLDKNKEVDPITFLKAEMKKFRITGMDFQRTGLDDQSHVSNILNKKRKINVRFIRACHKVMPTISLHILIQDYTL